MKFQQILLLILSVHYNLNAQSDSTYFKSHAIELHKVNELPPQAYKILSPYKLIMVGEMHGTNEPASFVTGLAELFTRYDDSVQVGFEIPTDQMNEFLKLKTDSSIYSSDFFSIGFNDGRSSNAWASAISTLTKNARVHIFFYDINTDESKTNDDRDSLMYLKIKNNLQAHPKWKMITLSGNIHNMQLPRNGKNKTAAYLRNDTELNLKDNLCSLNHNYQSGTMLNNIGKGLELRQVNTGVSPYAKLTGYDNYLYIYKNDRANTYSGIFFTKMITAATLTKTHRTFIVNGTITNAQKVPVDNSVYVTLLVEKGKAYKTYCDEVGRYQFILSDSLNGKRVIIGPSQDENKMKKYNIAGTCSYNCTTSDIYLTNERTKLKINTDSVRNYIVDFTVVSAIIDLEIPSLYFKKNGLQLVQSDRLLSTDSAICDITSIIQCNKRFRIQINGNCAPQEKDKENLSLKRATLIRERLITLGVNPSRITIKGSSDKNYRGTKQYYKAYGDSRPSYINKTDYEGQTVTFYIIGRDFKE